MNERPRAERRRFGELKATEPGAESAGRYFLDYFNHKARVLTEPEAGESSLKGGRRRPPGPASRHPRLLPRRPGPGRRPPLTLSGLALARANRGLEGQLGPDGQDGILYALEAQDLNLEGTRLVTLSACDTGRGAVDRSEGVCGLVCAFPIAGAQGVRMSLWPLDDALAAEFMGDFYRRWLSAGPHSDAAEALHAARLECIGSPDLRRRDPA